MSGQQEKALEMKWRIENLRSWLDTRDDSLYSPQFLAETFTNTRWKLSLSRKLSLAEKYISLALERDVDDDYSHPIAISYELSFMACDGSLLKSKSCTTKFVPKSVSQELNVKEVEILGEKKEAYLPEGALTVCCKMRKAWSSISKRRQCSLRSVIGTKCVTLNGIIHNFSKLHAYSYATVDFLSSSSEISFISFGVCLHDFLTFERTEIECKCFSSYTCELFVLEANGQREEIYIDNDHRKTLLNSQKSFAFDTHFYHSSLNSPIYLKNDTITFQMDITYFPGVESEYIEYDDDGDCKKLTADLKNLNTSNSEEVHSTPLDRHNILEQITEMFDNEKNEFGDEDECFDAAGKRHLPLTTFKEDLTSLYNDRLFCDTKLQTNTETFYTHRCVLSARSPVFKKMLTTDMKEKAGECINVPDISSDTVRRMLHFLYTDSTGHLDLQSAKDLYIASDKYDIVSLKNRCSVFIKKNLCPANVCEVIILADMHQDKYLESAAHEFVLTYDKEVFGSSEWKLFMKNFGSLAAQVMYLKCMK